MISFSKIIPYLYCNFKIIIMYIRYIHCQTLPLLHKSPLLNHFHHHQVIVFLLLQKLVVIVCYVESVWITVGSRCLLPCVLRDGRNTTESTELLAQSSSTEDLRWFEEGRAQRGGLANQPCTSATGSIQAKENKLTNCNK